MQKTLAAPELRAYVATVLIASGSSPVEAASVAANLVRASLCGHDSHGVGMLMRVAHNEGRRVSPGTLIDEHGRPSTDPGVVVVPQSNGLFGALLAFGEHKGYGYGLAAAPPPRP